MPMRKTIVPPPFVIDLDADPLQLGVEEPVGGVHLLPVTVPTPERYSKLIQSLARASGRLDGGDNRVKVAEASLAAVVAFLHEDRAVLLGGIARPLLLVQAALDNAAKGGRPALFLGRQKAQNRPGGVAFDVARGQLAALLDVLICRDLRTGQAADWLAAQLADRVIEHESKPITSHMLRKWREEVRQGIAPRRRSGRIGR